MHLLHSFSFTLSLCVLLLPLLAAHSVSTGNTHSSLATTVSFKVEVKSSSKHWLLQFKASLDGLSLSMCASLPLSLSLSLSLRSSFFLTPHIPSVLCCSVYVSLMRPLNVVCRLMCFSLSFSLLFSNFFSLCVLCLYPSARGEIARLDSSESRDGLVWWLATTVATTRKKTFATLVTGYSMANGKW